MENNEVLPTKTILICPNITASRQQQSGNSNDGILRPSPMRTIEAKLEEATRLVEALGLDIIAKDTPLIQIIKPSTFIGGGHVERIKEAVEETEAKLVVVDTALSPIQQRNLERAFETKVIDRTGLILEIFSARARTHEGRLQVELAALTFQRSRLVKSWSHLERQRGGFGFTGGPGESQIELDRRLIDDRIDHLKSLLVEVKRTRGLHRQARDRVPYPLVALVGYTNAGKSTLFNALTGAKVMAKDMLFATLDPTMRAISLPSKEKIILSDTVGFITNLPHELVAAFQATLEEVEHADIILHVRDAASISTREEKQDVENVLSRLTIAKDTPIIEIYNKIDLLEESEQNELRERKIAVSALKNEGLDKVMDAIEEALARHLIRSTIKLNAQQDSGYGAAYAWLHEHGKSVTLLSIDEDNGDQLLEVIWNPIDNHRFEAKFGMKAIS